MSGAPIVIKGRVPGEDAVIGQVVLEIGKATIVTIVAEGRIRNVGKVIKQNLAAELVHGGKSVGAKTLIVKRTIKL